MKLHIGVDTGGLPHAMFVSTADMQDRDGARCLIGYVYPHLSKVKKVLVDGGYTGDDFAQDVKWLINAEVEVVKRNEFHTFEVLPKRWIVERSFAWLEVLLLCFAYNVRKFHNKIQSNRCGAFLHFPESA